MRSARDTGPTGWWVAVVLAIVDVVAPASAQWVRVADVPATGMFAVWANGDTIAAGADTAVYVSTDSGASWKRSARPVAGVVAIDALWLRHGRLYAGTFGQGVHASDDLGDTWQAFNQGLVGGILDTQLDVVDLQVRGDSLCAATAGAGVYVRGLAGAGSWQPFGDVFEPNQASNVNSLALGGDRLLACAGSNGMVFIRDPSDLEWTVSNLDNIGPHASWQAMSAAWTGSGWVVGSNKGVFRSVAGHEPWTLTDLGLGPLKWTSFATAGRHLYAAFDTPLLSVMEDSGDDGATWQNAETLSGVFVADLAISGGSLYAARADGLWRRAIDTASVPAGGQPHGPRFALAGAQPFTDHVRLRFELPQSETVSIDIFDLLGRTVGERIQGWWPAGPHEVTLDARGMRPGIYTALLTAGGERETVRLACVR